MSKSVPNPAAIPARVPAPRAFRPPKAGVHRSIIEQKSIELGMLRRNLVLVWKLFTRTEPHYVYTKPTLSKAFTPHSLFAREVGQTRLHEIAARPPSEFQSYAAEWRRLLKSRSPDLAVRDRLGDTPLHTAARRGNAPAAQALLAAGYRADEPAVTYPTVATDAAALGVPGSTAFGFIHPTARTPFALALIYKRHDVAALLAPLCAAPLRVPPPLPDELHTLVGMPLRMVGKPRLSRDPECPPTPLEMDFWFILPHDIADVLRTPEVVSGKRGPPRPLPRAPGDPTAGVVAFEEVEWRVYKWSALHKAAAAGLTATATALLKGGADAKVVDTFGRTALHVAAVCAQTDIVMLLASGGGAGPSAVVDLDARTWANAYGRTALHLACLRGVTDTAVALVEVGANARIVMTNGWNAVRAADLNGHTLCAQKVREVAVVMNVGGEERRKGRRKKK